MLEAIDTYESLQGRAAQRGRQPALIESFGIRRLYGYRTISLSSRYAATILIAKNGTGKTTLLGALDAFLRLQLARLRNIDFGEIFCKINGFSDELVLTHDDLTEFLQVPQDGELLKLSGRLGLSPEIMFSFCLSDYGSILREYYNEPEGSGVAAKVMQAFSFDLPRALKACDEIAESLFQRVPRIREIRETLRGSLADYEVVYLPTYRRVELALTDEADDRRVRKRRRPKISVASGSLHTGDIQFGLSDISERLSEINRDIIVASNSGYRKISGNIITDLINGFELPADAAIPKPAELTLFFSRLESGGRGAVHYYPVSPPDFDRVYSGEGVPDGSRKFLTYFLGKLNEIVEITKTIERPVEDFINSCNKYLVATEPSTDLGELERNTHLKSIDQKIMRMDRKDLSVYVESIPGRKQINLDALSSGEKQMISLLAKLYLYPKRKLVLIDEPELSLSIDWQRGILVDVLLSPKCEQVIAITHSPFVFDNALEPFARSLDLAIEQSPELALNFEGDEGSIGDDPQ